MLIVQFPVIARERLAYALWLSKSQLDGAKYIDDLHIITGFYILKY